MYQRRVPILVLLIQFGVALQQEPHHLFTAQIQPHSYGAMSRASSQLCSCRAHLHVAVLAGQVKRRGALVGAGVDVGPVAYEQGQQGRVAVQGGDVQRREAISVIAVNTQSSSLQDGQLQDREAKVSDVSFSS